MAKIRPPAVAGAFYPGTKNLLENMIEDYLKNAVKKELKDTLKAIIVPHAGYIYSGIVAASGFRMLKKLDKDKDWKVVLLGPSHYAFLQGGAVSEAEQWETPLGKVKIKNIMDEIGGTETLVPNESVFDEEHSLEVEVPFLQSVLKKFTLYPVCLGDIDSQILANEIKDFIDREDVILVVSSDLSHYYEYDEAVSLDDNANKFIPIKAVNEIKNHVEACGIKGILTCVHLAETLGWEGHFVDYRNSGDTGGDKNQVVGYGCYAFTKK